MITLIITITLKYPAAVGEARTLQAAQNGAPLGVEPSRMGFEISPGLLR
jgi:hypothetical protein